LKPASTPVRPRQEGQHGEAGAPRGRIIAGILERELERAVEDALRVAGVTEEDRRQDCGVGGAPDGRERMANNSAAEGAAPPMRSARMHAGGNRPL